MNILQPSPRKSRDREGMIARLKRIAPKAVTAGTVITLIVQLPLQLQVIGWIAVAFCFFWCLPHFARLWNETKREYRNGTLQK